MGRLLRTTNDATNEISSRLVQPYSKSSPRKPGSEPKQRSKQLVASRLEKLVPRKPELPVCQTGTSGFDADSQITRKKQEWHPKEAGGSGLTVEEKMRDLRISEGHKKEDSRASTTEMSEAAKTAETEPNRKFRFSGFRQNRRASRCLRRGLHLFLNGALQDSLQNRRDVYEV
jgi:hypothetical protein